ncbi:unnamed protein product [Didymodactylos carnosus]|uniref:BRCT domain-containing protein n=2 Tax=Didymodactylos carnosus TaxID=1234261 RepID=A0A814MHC4_9BILA|nr:unnamed protein product [Didymodactylos carnosus]CAF3845333.1 unnamed protein product [Didymodactylos carnosus]
MQFPLNGLTFVLDQLDLRFKEKTQLINYLREQNAKIASVLTASTDYLLVKREMDTYKTLRAKKLGIPSLNINYIYECQQNPDKVIDPNSFIVTSPEDKENFKNGNIPIKCSTAQSSSSVTKLNINTSKIKVWNYDDSNLPKFDEENAEVAKWAIFKETNDYSYVYFVLEIQVIPNNYFQFTTSDYRIRFRYEKQATTDVQNKNETNNVCIQYMFTDDVNEQQQLFLSYYNRIATMPRIARIKDMLPNKIGSKLLLRLLWSHKIDTQTLVDSVCQLVESIWLESIGDLQEMLNVKPESIILKNRCSPTARIIT